MSASPITPRRFAGALGGEKGRFKPISVSVRGLTSSNSEEESGETNPLSHLFSAGLILQAAGAKPAGSGVIGVLKMKKVACFQ